VADSTSNVWIDSTFVGAAMPEPLENNKDTAVQLKFVTADNIGGYSIPVIYVREATSQTDIDTKLTYFQQPNTLSGIQNIASTYRAFEPPKMDGVVVSLVEFNSSITITSGTINNTITYRTGYNSISGALDERITFTGGRNMLNFMTVPSYFSTTAQKEMYKDWWVNYTDFSGNLTTSGTPIPFYNSDYSLTAEYGEDFEYFSLGWINNIVDISFAGWVGFPLNSDIYSTLLRIKTGCRTEITSISGNVNAHYIDIFSSDLSVSGINTDIYSSLIDYSKLNIELEAIYGGIDYTQMDLYSTIETNNSIMMSIDLLSLKLSNFSLDIGECTTASGFIYIDITDDECAISLNSSYFEVDGSIVSVTFVPIDGGYRMIYDPDDNFTSLKGITIFIAHAENECGKVLEQSVYLTFGYIVEYINNKLLDDSIDFGFQHKVIARVTAENNASCPQISSLAWDFKTISQLNVDLGASITGRFHAYDYGDMPAKIYPHSTAYFYGKEFKVVVKAKDFAGNQMEPLILNYKIEDRP